MLVKYKVENLSDSMLAIEADKIERQLQALEKQCAALKDYLFDLKKARQERKNAAKSAKAS